MGQLIRAGLPYAAAQGAALLLAAAAIAYGLRSGRAGVPTEDRAAHLFICCLVGSLVASPIVWSHYLLLLAAVPALLRLRPRWFWLCSLVIWIPGFPAGGPAWLMVAGQDVTSWLQHGTVYALLAAAVLLPGRATRNPSPHRPADVEDAPAVQPPTAHARRSSSRMPAS